MKAIVIYHANCMDGFGAAWAFHTLVLYAYKDGVEYFPCSYGQTPPIADTDYSQAHLFILDFSFPRKILEEYCKIFLQVHLYDHHKTAIEALRDWQDKPLNLRLVLDSEHSGAMITWRELAPYEKQTPSQLILYIEDRDLWQFKLWKSKEVNAYIALQDKTFENYTLADKVITKEPIFVSEAGSLLMKQHQKICEEIADEARPCSIQDSSGSIHQGLVSNCTGQFASEVGNILAKRSGTFGATYFQSASGDTKWSLRSIGDFDTTPLSKTYGGGGHKNASGFVLSAPSPSGENEGVTLWHRFGETAGDSL